MNLPEDNNRLIFFTDIDGTLVDDEKKLSDSNRKALDRFLYDGNILCFSTGRALSGAKNLVASLGFADRKNVYIAAYNGGLLYDTYDKKVIAEKTIPIETVFHVFDDAHTFGIHIQTYSETAVISEEDNAFLQKYLQIQKLPAIIVGDIRKPGAISQEPCKILAIDFDDPERIERFRDFTVPHFKKELDIFRSSPYLLEFVPKGVNKGAALKSLCSLTGVSEENTISAGDAENDLPMIIAAAHGCVVANGEQLLKDHADYVTERDNNHSAVAEILRRFAGVTL